MYLIWSIETGEFLDPLDIIVDKRFFLMTPIIVDIIPKNRIENPEPNTIAMIAPALSVSSTMYL